MDFQQAVQMMNFHGYREGDDPLETKYVYTTHSELNAILELPWRKSGRRENYMYLYSRAMNVQKQSFRRGLREVIYDSNKYEGTPSVCASMRMFDAAGVRYHQYHRTNREVRLEL